MSTKKQVSSGAEKAEKLERKTQKTPAKQTQTRGKQTKTHSTAKPRKTNAATKREEKPAKQMSEKKKLAIEKKLAAREKRQHKKLEMAKLRAEKRQRKLEKKLEHKQKKLERIAALKEKRAERKEKRRERRDLLKSETKAQRIERKKEERRAKVEARAAKREAAAADKRAKREHRLKVRAQKRAEKNDKRHAPGFGGWLAAVISLGVTTLALGTALTFGWLGMNNMQGEMANVQVRSLYELNSIVDNLDSNLSKARVAVSENDRVKLLSDIAIQSEMAEMVIERMPMDTTVTQEITSFVNKMGDSAQSMLYTVARGGELTPSQERSLEYMYETNLKVKRVLNDVSAKSNCSDVMNCLRGKESVLGNGFKDLQNNVIEMPKGIQDGPFADSVKDTNPSFIMELDEITAPRAEELAKEMFKDYKVSSARCTGEAAAKNITVYNVTLSTPNGEMMAQLSKKGGKLVMFNSFKDCSDKNFSVDRCITIAQDFLEDIGYGELKAVWSSENGTTCNLNFAPVSGGAVLYPDLIKVKVCEERGLVTGVEAISYVLNHGDRNIGGADVSENQARGAINGNLEVTSSRLAVIPTDGGERLAYEFFGSMGDNEYFVYVDAQTGEEIQVLTVVGTKQGKSIL